MAVSSNEHGQFIYVIDNFCSLKTVPFTLPPAPVQRERIGGFTFPPPSSPSKEILEQPLGWNSERRLSYTGAPHLATGD